MSTALAPRTAQIFQHVAQGIRVLTLYRKAEDRRLHLNSTSCQQAASHVLGQPLNRCCGVPALAQKPFSFARTAEHYTCRLQSYSSTTPSGTQPDSIDLPGLDRKWQRRWEEHAARLPRKDDSQKPKAYVLPMFPYPSGNLHMGHLRVYTIADVLSRWKKMKGFEVLNPMGWDAFGLPAENAAIERGIDPADWTKDNIAKMKGLLKEMNTDIRWEQEFATCDPAFYKHTQKLFTLLFQHGLAYQAEALVNWDPVDKTVLANEQVDKDGKSWRSGAKVEQRMLKQWFFKVTQFQDSLLKDLEFLSQNSRWPERVIAMQRNWLGRSEGTKLTFKVQDENTSPLQSKPVHVFTTRPDTLFGVQFLALSCSHPIVLNKTKHDRGLQEFVQRATELPTGSKEGYLIKDISAVSPAALLENAPEGLDCSIPIFAAPYVLDEYGEGAVMGVPGHDERDYEFWRANEPAAEVRQVVEGPMTRGSAAMHEKVFTGLGYLTAECGEYAGMSSKAAGQEMVRRLTNFGVASATESWRLRDWLVSRQRYWGTPIPIIHCETCGPVAVPDEQLPVELPSLSGKWFKGKTGNPLEKAQEWQDVPCPNCHSPSKRDTDTMDTFVDSSWYFMRFPDAQNKKEPFSALSVNRMLPVDIYIGGIEHAILHLLYARFMSKFLTSVGLWPLGTQQAIRGEPFHTLISQGMVHGKTYSDPDTGRFLLPTEIDLSSAAHPRIKDSTSSPHISFQKMSKSKHNGVDPTNCLAQFGADVVRAHVLFAAPVEDVLNWDDSKVIGAQRWLSRLWRHICKVREQLSRLSDQELSMCTKLDEELLARTCSNHWIKLQILLSNIHRSYETTSLNTLVSDLMKLTHQISQDDTIPSQLMYQQTSILLRAMAPVTPAFAEEGWEALHATFKDRGVPFVAQTIFEQNFPKFNSLSQSQIQSQTCAVQQNGKLRFTVDIPCAPEHLTTSQSEWVLKRLGETKDGKTWLEMHPRSRWKKIIVVKGGKTINFVK